MRSSTSSIDSIIKSACLATALAFAGGANAQQATDPTPSTSGTASETVRDGADTTQGAATRDTGSSSAGAASGSVDNASTAGSTTTGSTGSTSATGGTASGASSAGTRNAAGSAGSSSVEPIWLLIPVEFSARTDQMSNGCWVQLYSGDNFEGRVMTVVGPSNLAEVRSPYGTGLNNWESAVVGPNATVTTYDDENFRARDATLRPGQRYPKLDDTKLGLFEDIESMRVTCSRPAGQATSASGASGSANASGSNVTSGSTSGTATTGDATAGSR
jgi:hypothetical protein